MQHDTRACSYHFRTAQPSDHHGPLHCKFHMDISTTEAESDIPVHVRVHVHDSCSRTQNEEESKGRSFTTPFFVGVVIKWRAGNKDV